TGRRHPAAARTARGRRLPAGRTLRDAAGTGARRADQSRADPVRAAATAPRRSVVVPACAVHERTRSGLVERRARRCRDPARSRPPTHAARTTGKGRLRTPLRPVPRRPRTVHSAGDPEPPPCTGGPVPPDLESVP